jgi:general secretion pathway protein I
VKRARAAGFTLVEILVALLVLAIALAATARSLGAAIDTTAALRDRTLARWVAEDRLAELELSGEWPALDVKEGKSSIAGREFVWRRETSATPYARMRRVELSVLLAGADASIARLTAFVEQTTPPPGTQSGAQPAPAPGGSTEEVK